MTRSAAPAPGRSWSWLGNYYTPESLSHDKAVRGNLAAGSSPVMTHAKALPLLPRSRRLVLPCPLPPGSDDMHLPEQARRP